MVSPAQQPGHEDDGPSVRLQHVDLDYRDAHLFESASDTGGTRSERATALATLGYLSTREVEHLRWLAISPTGFEAIHDGVQPVTREAAEKIVEIIERTPQLDRPAPARGAGPITTAGLSGAYDRR